MGVLLRYAWSFPENGGQPLNTGHSRPDWPGANVLEVLPAGYAALLQSFPLRGPTARKQSLTARGPGTMLLTWVLPNSCCICC